MKNVRIWLLAFFLIELFQPANIKAGIILSIWEGIATEPTQIMNNIELIGIQIQEIIEVEQQVEQLAHEVEMINNQLLNLLKVPEYSLSIVNELMDLSRAIEKGQVLSYVAANIDEQYADKYPGYLEYVSNHLSVETIHQRYKEWSTHNIDSVKAVLKSLHIQEETIVNEDRRVETIQSLSKSAEGRLQALQAGNLLASEQAKSLQRLRQLLMVNSQLQANYQAKQQDEQDIRTAKWMQLTEGEGTTVGDENSILNDF